MLGTPTDSITDTATSKGVFSFTEVITEKFTLPPIPGVTSQVNSPTFHHKSASLPRFKSPESLLHSRSRLDQLDQQAQEYFSDREFLLEGKKRLRRLEGSMLIAGEVALAKQGVRDTKSRLDTVVLQRRAKERMLSKLILESHQIVTIASAEPEKTPEILQLREAELEETLQACKNELHYRETLLYMLESRQKNSLILQEPLRLLKDDLEKLSKELNLKLKRTLELEAAVETITKHTETLHSNRQTAREHQEILTQDSINRYKDKQKLLLSLQLERKELQTLRSMQKLQSLAAVLELKLVSLQGKEAEEEEIKALQLRGKAEERKFKGIQQRTSISSLLDIEPYWRYLCENRDILESAVSTAERTIEELTAERERWKGEVRKLVEDEGDVGYLSREEVEYMDKKLSVKERELKGSEDSLRPLQDMTIAATNTITQLAGWVLLDRQDLDVKPSNAASCLLSCADALETMLKAGPRLEVPPSPTLLPSSHSLQPSAVRQKRRKTTRRSATTLLSP